MDPATHTQVTTSSVLLSMYDPLVFRGPDGALVPGLATEWATTDATHWRFTLRKDVTFSNGEAFDADDVVYTVDRVLAPETKSPTRSNFSTVSAVRAVDPSTVEFTTTAPDPLLPQRLTQTSLSSLIVPKDYLEAHGGAVPEDAPVGTGPYTLDEWVKDDHVTLSARSGYWGDDTFWPNGTKPTRVTWRPVPEAAARVAALRNGEADLVTTVPPELAATLSGDAVAIQALADTAFFVTINTESVPAFRDARVRQALNYAVDKGAIVTNILSGAGEAIPVTIAQGSVGFPNDLGPYPFDPERARQLLAEAGHAGGQGIGPIDIMSRSGRFLKDVEVTQAIAGYLRDVGLDVTAQFVESGVWAQLGEEHKRGALQFGGWNNASDPALSWFPLLRTGAFQSYFSDPTLDGLLDTGQVTLDDAQRAGVYAQAAQRIYAEAPHIFMYQGAAVYGRSSRVTFTPNRDEQINIRELEITG
jgi:peptide/nickel transport system substrate-binding protein